MNEDVLKPFPCKESGCGMGFFTEDHLSVHQQAKHNKLNLEIPKGSNVQIFSDQTPTPTRLLNNCEELRVFDDLQNINPFEEGFRRAVEDSSNGVGRDSLMTPSNQDTLHTPQILPHFEPCLVKSEIQVQEEPENLSIPTTPVAGELSDIPKLSNSDDLKNSQKPTHVPISILPKPTIYASPLITAPPSIRLAENSLCEDVKTNESVKDKLKNILLHNSANLSDKKRIKTENVPTIIIGAVPVMTSTPANFLLTSGMKISNNETSQTTVVPKTSNSSNRKRTRDDKTDASKLKVERNRAAAKRYRTKMKIQSQALQDKHEKSQREIMSLKKELADMWKELTRVKAMLLLHKDCPVTKAQANQVNPPADL